MQKVILVLDNPSIVMDEFLNELPYAVILLDKRITETYTIEPDPKDIVRKQNSNTISKYDMVAKTHYSYEQSCILYNTKNDLDSNNGIYQDFLPELFDDYIYEYTCRLI